MENTAYESTETLQENGHDKDKGRVKHESVENGSELMLMKSCDQNSIEISDEPDREMEKNLRDTALAILAHLIAISYFSYASYRYVATRESCVKDCELTLCSAYGMLLLVFGATYIGFLYYRVIKKYLGQTIDESLVQPLKIRVKEIFTTLKSKAILAAVLIAIFSAYIVFETYADLSRLRALLGVAIFVSIGYLISENRKRIIWRPVICGAIFQFLLGVLFIRWPVGRAIFECFGSKVATFLAFAKDGASFVFGDFLVRDKSVFAFAVLPTIFYFSLFISMGYYLGAIQWILFKLGWILQSILGTTVCESVNAAGNIFLGMTESPLIIKPYLKYLTDSEIHAVMVSGFATVSGSVLLAYISFGAEPQHLITASVMAAPASLFFSKLVYPELEESKTSTTNIQLEKSPDSSLLDAATNGASQGVMLVLNIIANLVAFVAFVTFADSMLVWLTTLLGFEGMNIQFILGKLFMPISWLIGIKWEDCEAVGNVIGMKTIVNEFVAFQKLGEYKAANTISLRSSAIATFAICSFANPASIGITIGALSALAPERRPSITKVALRAFISGCFVTLITASIAGLLISDLPES